MYVCMYVCMYACMYIYVSMYLCIYVSMYLCIYVSIFVCMYVCMYVCIYLSIYPSVYLSIYLYIPRPAWASIGGWGCGVYLGSPWTLRGAYRCRRPCLRAAISVYSLGFVSKEFRDQHLGFGVGGVGFGVRGLELRNQFLGV